MNRYLLIVLAVTITASCLLLPRAAVAQEACANAVQGRIAWDRKGSTRWNRSNIDRLCKGAESSKEPARCFDRVMHGGVKRGDGGAWGWRKAVELCQGTYDAGARIDCYQERVGGGSSIDAAIRGCRNIARTPGRIAHRDREVSKADHEPMVLADPNLSNKVVTAPNKGGDGNKPVVRPQIDSDAMRKSIAKQATQNQRRREQDRNRRCQQVSLIRGRIELEGAESGGDVLRLQGCLGQPDPDDVQIWVRSGERIEKHRGRFSGTSASVSNARLAASRGAQATLVRTRGDETYQLVPWVDVERVTADADGDGHDAPRWGGDDCDDSDARRFPGNAEIPDERHVDEDCDPSTYGKVDDDRDGFYSDEYCNRAGDGSMNCGTDCDDSLSNVNPRHNDTPGDGLDNDCDGEIDG